MSTAHSFQWEWEECIIELIVCNSLSDDENNNTIRPIRTVSVLWNWHFFWYIYCHFWEPFLRRLWPTMRNTHQWNLCQQHECQFSCVIFFQLQYVPLFFFSCWSCFSSLDLCYSALWFQSTPEGCESLTKYRCGFAANRNSNRTQRVVSTVDNRRMLSKWRQNDSKRTTI